MVYEQFEAFINYCQSLIAMYQKLPLKDCFISYIMHSSARDHAVFRKHPVFLSYHLVDLIFAVCMCVCVCVCVCVYCMHICVVVDVCVCVCVYMYVCPVCVCTCIYIICVCRGAGFVRIYVCVRLCVCVTVCVCTYIWFN